MVILLETYLLATSTSIREAAGLGQLWYAWQCRQIHVHE